MNKLSLRTVAVATASALTFASVTTVPAYAQPAPDAVSEQIAAQEAPVDASQPGSAIGGSAAPGGFLGNLFGESSSRNLLYQGSQLPFISVTILRLFTGLLSLPGLNRISVAERFAVEPAEYPLALDGSITEPRVVDRSVASDYPGAAEQRIERWTIASPSMGRNVLVDVRPSTPGEGPAPTLVLLDGVEAPSQSGWLDQWSGGIFDETFGNENATVVLPLQANASWYSDWEQDDPKLGRMKWETFITTELIPLVEAQEGIEANGKRAIGGLSMGATGAVHIANQHPELFNGVFGISGCYSTMDSIGRQISLLVPQTRGGAPEHNMWGRYGSPEWRRHDVTRAPGGLNDKAVYLSTATGGLSEDQYNSDEPTTGLTVGWALEAGTYQCTKDLEKAMRRSGATNLKINYKDRGTHNWENFRVELEPAWQHIKPSLY